MILLLFCLNFIRKSNKIKKKLWAKQLILKIHSTDPPDQLSLTGQSEEKRAHVNKVY